MWSDLNEILTENSLDSDSYNGDLRDSEIPSGAEPWTKMC